MQRRDFLRLALSLPFAGAFASWPRLTAAETGKTRITGMKLKPISRIGHTLVRIDTDSGVSGFGESGVSGPMMVAWRERYLPAIMGRDPLAIQRHFHVMSTQMHPYMARIPALSGIDMALWDLAGKLTNHPVYELLGGPFRDSVTMFINTQPRDMLNKAEVRDWAAQLRENPLGFKAVKINTTAPIGRPAGQWTTTLSTQDVARIRTAFENVRQELGPDYDIMVHCHNEYDLPSSVAIARAVEGINPKWLEDPLPPPYSDSWLALKRDCRVPLLTGEKMEMPGGFYPFLKNQAVDFIYPDIAFCGGITAAVKIATLAEMYRIPVATHNVGGILLTAASIHFGVSIFGFLTSECRLSDRTSVLAMANEPLAVKNGTASPSQRAGLGVELNDEGVKAWQSPGDSPDWM